MIDEFRAFGCLTMILSGILIAFVVWFLLSLLLMTLGQITGQPS